MIISISSGLTSLDSKRKAPHSRSFHPGRGAWSRAVGDREARPSQKHSAPTASRRQGRGGCVTSRTTGCTSACRGPPPAPARAARPSSPPASPRSSPRPAAPRTTPSASAPRRRREPRQHLRGEVHPLLRRHGPVPGDPLATPPSQVTSHPISVFNARWPRTANSWRRGTMAMSLVSPNNCWQTSITRSALPARSNDPT